MNTLPPIRQNTWQLPNHAHIVAYEERERGLLTIYDCGAAQKPPSAQVLGRLTLIDADAEVTRTATGRVVSLREPATLERVGEDQWSIY